MMNGVDVLRLVLKLRQREMNKGRFGPFVLVVPVSWTELLNGDYVLTGGMATQLVRERLLMIDGISHVEIDHNRFLIPPEEPQLIDRGGCPPVAYEEEKQETWRDRSSQL